MMVLEMERVGGVLTIVRRVWAERAVEGEK
jgi:hypothetical protein